MRLGDVLAELSDAPVLPWQDVIGDGGLVVLAPHPDDEALGCGGIIAAACAAGRRVHVVVLTDGSMSHPRSQAYPADRLTALRTAEVRQSVTALGLSPEDVTCLGLPDAAAPRSGPAFDGAVEAIAALCDATQATALLVSWEHDPHCDHEVAAQVAAAVGEERPRLKVWRYPIWGLHRAPDDTVDQRPWRGARVDVARHLERKKRALDCHASQLGRVIVDDASGFHLTPEVVAAFFDGYERFIGDPA